jgi:Mg-chelatase subunit ChlD
MGSKLQKSREAAAEFFKAANPADEFFLVQFNDRPELIVPFTTDTDKIQSALTFTQSRGRTALLDAVYLAMHLGYTPKNGERDGKYRLVQVKLNQSRGLPPLQAYFRLGYYAPTQ